jgi:hypothetical protein
MHPTSKKPRPKLRGFPPLLPISAPQAIAVSPSERWLIRFATVCVGVEISAVTE